MLMAALWSRSSDSPQRHTGFGGIGGVHEDDLTTNFYRVNLNHEGKGDLLYLTLPDHVYKRFQKKPSFLETFAASLIKLVIVDIDREVITQWQD